MDLSEQISKMADDYDESSNHEVEEGRALLQGVLVGSVAQLAAAGGALGIAHASQGRLPDGDYERHFLVVMRNGVRLRVSVEPA